MIHQNYNIIKNKFLYTITTLLAVLFLSFISCKKDPEPNNIAVKITKESIAPATTSIYIVGSYSYPSVLKRITIFIGKKSDLSDAVAFDATIWGFNFSLAASISLDPKTTYYYCYEFYNEFNSIKTTAKLLTHDIWTQKANFGGGKRYGAVGFTIGNKGYIGTGKSDFSSYHDDFWEYNPLTNTWTQKANFGGGTRAYAVGFSIGDKGYIGIGKSDFSSYHDDFWEYNPSTNIWTQKANFGGGTRNGAVGFSIGNKGYIGTGSSSGYDYYNDLWEYIPSTNTWTQKANFRGGKRAGAVGFAIGNKGYIGTGNGYDSYSHSYRNDFWEYNPSTDTWTQKANFGGGESENAVGFSIGDKGYIGTGDDNDSYHNDFLEYTPE